METRFEIGKCYLVQTVTHFFTGRLKAQTATELVLEDAAWIADTGRYMQALKDGVLNEIEPITGDLIVARGALVCAPEWRHKLPSEQK